MVIRISTTRLAHYPIGEKSCNEIGVVNDEIIITTIQQKITHLFAFAQVIRGL